MMIIAFRKSLRIVTQKKDNNGQKIERKHTESIDQDLKKKEFVPFEDRK